MSRLIYRATRDTRVSIIVEFSQDIRQARRKRSERRPLLHNSIQSKIILQSESNKNLLRHTKPVGIHFQQSFPSSNGKISFLAEEIWHRSETWIYIKKGKVLPLDS